MTTIRPDGLDTRTALLAAARAELTEHGRAAIGLRAVARRAGVSHAAPTYFFQDRAGMLTAVATQGFHELGEALRAVDTVAPQHRLAALGRAYIDFGLTEPALFDLMFRPGDLRTADPDLAAARQASIEPLVDAVAAQEAPRDRGADRTPAMALVSWALVHGLVALARDGALQEVAGAPAGDDGSALAGALADLFADRVISRGGESR
ncbi:TetR-like C-terminal domain-containing protein [uncultured Amnibacterium sp.]|uniref:TetR-like C-terminal domain-containing protein n=1 Tax=uncultured Amnibacterium sp. TaxID=1631851 RepID=UPI0035CC8180